MEETVASVAEEELMLESRVWVGEGATLRLEDRADMFARYDNI